MQDVRYNFRHMFMTTVFLIILADNDVKHKSKRDSFTR